MKIIEKVLDNLKNGENLSQNVNFVKEYLLSAKEKSKNDITKAFRYANDDEWYTTKEDIKFFIDNAKIPQNKVIWCPFDLPDSNFVTVF
ncbi:hypothetical protein ACXYRK_01930 [Mycoplasma sp. AC1221]